MSENTTAELPVPPPPENVKDMSSSTRKVLQRLGNLLKKAPALDPEDQTSPDRVQAPAPTSAPSLASAANGDGISRPQPAPAATESSGQPTDAGVPQ